MSNDKSVEEFNIIFKKLNEKNKQYVIYIIEAFIFAQDFLNSKK